MNTGGFLFPIALVETVPDGAERVDSGGVMRTEDSEGQDVGKGLELESTLGLLEPVETV